MPTIGSHFDFVDPAWRANPGPLAWPPRMFALAASLLRVRGAYVDVLRDWPRLHAAGGPSWHDRMQTIGRQWRSSVSSNGAAPAEVTAWWMALVASAHRKTADIESDRSLTEILLSLVAAADEACFGAGFPSTDAENDAFLREASLRLATHSTLCPELAIDRVLVLPKQHTPRSGLTLRSLTHHLSVHFGPEVRVEWLTLTPDFASREAARTSFNVLAVPWPLQVSPRQFRPAAPDHGSLHEMPRRFGFVEFDPDRDPAAATTIVELIEAARRDCGRVDAVVLPELALSQADYLAVRDAVVAEGCIFIAGVCRPPATAGSLAENLVAFDARIGPAPVHLEQTKHHRWRLDRSQIEMYSLAGRLDPNREWWEHTALGQRRLHFVSLSDELTICFLICEDLARQDPVAEIVRSVGPNLVIALLMDGPQLGVRWPARYATVLADDPGSSVLTLSSVGMVDLTRAPRGVKPSRSVALWKDARSAEAVELELPQGAEALLLSLYSESVEECTADGRGDGGVTAHSRLGGVRPIRRAAGLTP